MPPGWQCRATMHKRGHKKLARVAVGPPDLSRKNQLVTKRAFWTQNWSLVGVIIAQLCDLSSLGFYDFDRLYPASLVFEELDEGYLDDEEIPF